MYTLIPEWRRFWVRLPATPYFLHLSSPLLALVESAGSQEKCVHSCICSLYRSRGSSFEFMGVAVSAVKVEEEDFPAKVFHSSKRVARVIATRLPAGERLNPTYQS